MKTCWSVAAYAAGLSFAAFANEAKDTKAAKAEAVFLTPSDLKWGEAPPALPKGAQVAVLHGNPFAKGFFATRLKLPDGSKIAPHWHTTAENLTIISGTLVLHMGDTMDSPAHSLEAAAYHYLPAKMHHAAKRRARPSSKSTRWGRSTSTI
jgi:uncharacterized protein DUF4437